MGRDFTKYYFDGSTCTKGRLVLAIVSKYVKLNSKTTLNELKNIFPDNLQANTLIQFSNVRVVFENIEKIKPNEQKRFFIHENELITLADSVIAVCREWNKENIMNFIKKAKQLDFEI